MLNFLLHNGKVQVFFLFTRRDVIRKFQICQDADDGFFKTKRASQRTNIRVISLSLERKRVKREAPDTRGQCRIVACVLAKR